MPFLRLHLGHGTGQGLIVASDCGIHFSEIPLLLDQRIFETSTIPFLSYFISKFGGPILCVYVWMGGCLMSWGKIGQTLSRLGSHYIVEPLLHRSGAITTGGYLEINILFFDIRYLFA